MNNELTGDLLSKYPFYRCDESKIKNGFISDLMFFGFSCGDGWYNILNQVGIKIIKLKKKYPNMEFKAEQIKEKYGELRIYYYCKNEP
ncbi:MAG: hypothetical protein ACREBJ_13180, partial [Nitrosotalea sp.]